jgi:hypothetical protein
MTGLTSSPTPGTSHTFVWASATDLATTSDSTVYIRVRPNDGTVSADAWATSTAFGIDNVAPGDVCAGSPVAGTVCGDGTAYVTSTLRTTPSNVAGSYAWGPNVTTGATDAFDWRNNIPLLTPLSSYPAAQACNNSTANGHNDWYLPAKDELNTLWINRVAIGNFNTTMAYYWSSTESYANYAIIQWFIDGLQDDGIKYNVVSVRCVRRLSVGEITPIPAPTFGTITTSSIVVNQPSASDSGSGLTYWMVRRNNPSTESAWIPVATTTYTSDSLSGNTEYTYDVRFKDTIGNISSYGTTAKATTLIPNTAPNSPTSPTQLNNDASTTISNGGYTNETNVKLRASVTDSDNPDTETLFFEAVANSGSFASPATPTTGTSCAS